MSTVCCGKLAVLPAATPFFKYVPRCPCAYLPCPHGILENGGTWTNFNGFSVEASQWQASACWSSPMLAAIGTWFFAPVVAHAKYLRWCPCRLAYCCWPLCLVQRAVWYLRCMVCYVKTHLINGSLPMKQEAPHNPAQPLDRTQLYPRS